jgi:hypothetical protein
MRRFAFIISILFAGIACRSTNSSQTFVNSAEAEPMIISLEASSSLAPIDSMPFHFWLQSKTQPILATNRTKGALNYISQNRQLNIPVSQAAIKCMSQVFSTIAASDVKKSEQWSKYRKKYPYRFLELLPEVKDFYSEPFEHEIPDFRQLTTPVLWNGFEATGEAKPTDTGFKARGYLKWVGVLLPDGNTCMITSGSEVLKLLELSMKCEDGDQTSCYFPTETIP